MFAVSAHPVRVDGKLDMPISRWLWLAVKWALAVPHFIILFFFSLAFFVLATSSVAFFSRSSSPGAIPRSVFDSDVRRSAPGRMASRLLSTYGALGTTVCTIHASSVPDYPASVGVAYPEQLSRGLVLVAASTTGARVTAVLRKATSRLASYYGA